MQRDYLNDRKVGSPHGLRTTGGSLPPESVYTKPAEDGPMSRMRTPIAVRPVAAIIKPEWSYSPVSSSVGARICPRLRDVRQSVPSGRGAQRRLRERRSQGGAGARSLRIARVLAIPVGLSVTTEPMGEVGEAVARLVVGDNSLDADAASRCARSPRPLSPPP